MYTFSAFSNAFLWRVRNLEQREERSIEYKARVVERMRVGRTQASARALRSRIFEKLFDLIFVEFNWSAPNSNAFFNHYLANLLAVEKNNWRCPHLDRSCLRGLRKVDVVKK